MNKPLMSYEETARLLGVKLGTLYAWVHHRKIPHVRLGDRLVRFDRAEIEGWLDARRVASAARRATG